MDRRTFLSVSALAAAAQVAGVGGAAAQSPANAPVASKPSRLEKLAKAIASNRMSLSFDGARFSGPAFDWLLSRGAESQAFLLGEEHGIAENPKLAAQLFTALIPRGYRRLAVEISPPMADEIDRVIKREPPGSLRKFLIEPESRVAFFGLREEADFLQAARQALPANESILWGLDYEVGADRYLIRSLKDIPKPAEAQAAWKALDSASSASWARYHETKNPQFIFSFAGDPSLVQTLRSAWPRADARSRQAMETLEQTFTINALWVSGKGHESNLRRARFMRSSLLRHWNAEGARNPPPRVFMKFGASHMVRGLSMTDVFDVGSLVPELAAARGGRSFHLLVLAGSDSQTANLDPTTFRYVPGKRDQYGAGAEPFHAATLPTGFTLFDTVPLRALAPSSDRTLHPELVRAIHGFDAVLVMTGSTPSSNL